MSARLSSYALTDWRFRIADRELHIEADAGNRVLSIVAGEPSCRVTVEMISVAVAMADFEGLIDDVRRDVAPLRIILTPRGDFMFEVVPP